MFDLSFDLIYHLKLAPLEEKHEVKVGIKMKKNVSVKINNVSLPLNPFVQKMVERIVSGMLDALDHVPQPVQQVTIEINTPQKEECQG